MHFEFLVEGQSELTTLSTLMSQILGEYRSPHTWKIHKHRGVGSLPEDPSKPPSKTDPSLLHNLPSKLRAYAREQKNDLIVIVLVDLDDRGDCAMFKRQMVNLKTHCRYPLHVLFRIAIEELEAWFLGDKTAIKMAYPGVKETVLEEYEQDSICHTWEKLAEAIYPGGLSVLLKDGKRSREVLRQKVEWAKKISPYMNIDENVSPSFRTFRDGIRQIANGAR